MAGPRVRGITIELGADVSELTDALQKANKDLKETDKTLRDIEKGLKLDPKNVELLSQKMRYLKQAIDETDEKLKQEKDLLRQLEAEDGGTGKLQKSIDAVKREIVDTERKQEAYKKQLEGTKAAAEGAAEATDKYGDAAGEASEKQGLLGEAMNVGNLKAMLFTEAVKLGAKALGEFIKFVGGSIKASAEYADNILTLATVTGLSTDELQEMQYMAELVDVSVDTITGSMAKLTKNMASANNGNKAMAENFEKLGVSLTDASGNLRDNEDVFADAIAALGNISNETERDALAMQIFGKSAQDLNPLIAQGADNLEALRQEAHEVGYVLDEETLGSLGQMDDAFQRMNKVVETAQNQIGSMLAPVIADITNKFVEWAQSVDWEAVGLAVGEFITAVIQFIQAAVPVIQGIIDNIILIFKALWSFVQSLWDFFVGAWEGITGAVQAASDILGPIIDGIVGFFQKVWDVVDSVITKIGDFVGVIGDAIGKAGEFFNGVGGRVASFFGYGSGGFGSGGFASYTQPAFASGGYNLSTAVTINNYSTPVTGAMADRIVDVVNAKLGRMLK